MKKKLYERPAMQVVRLQSMPMMQQASPTGNPTISAKKASMSVTYEEEDW